MTTPIDTHYIYKTLTLSGFSEEQAAGILEVGRHITHATDSSMQHYKSEMKEDFILLDQKVGQLAQKVEQLDQKVEQLDKKFDKVESSIHAAKFDILKMVVPLMFGLYAMVIVNFFIH